MNYQPSISHDETVIRRLHENAEFATEYLKAALENTGAPQVLLITLRHIVEANGGIAKVAKAAGIEGKSLRRMLFGHGDPHVAVLMPVIKAMGLKLTVAIPIQHIRNTTLTNTLT